MTHICLLTPVMIPDLHDINPLYLYFPGLHLTNFRILLVELWNIEADQIFWPWRRVSSLAVAQARLDEGLCDADRGRNWIDHRDVVTGFKKPVPNRFGASEKARTT